MAIRQKPSGNWEVYYRSPSTGKRVAITFRTEKEAVQKDALIKYQLKNERETLMTEEKTRKRGQASAAKVEEGTGFEDVVYRYLKAKRYTPESLTSQYYQLKPWIEAFGTKDCRTITRGDIGGIKADMFDAGIKGSTIRRKMVALRAVLRWAEDEGIIDEAPKLPPFPPDDNARFVPPTMQEIAKMIAAAPDHLQRVILLGFCFGMRIGSSELFRLTWADVDLPRKTLRIPSSRKNRHEPWRELPIRDQLIPIFMGWRLHDETIQPMPTTVVNFKGAPVGTIKTAWAHMLKEAGIARKIRPYDLRHAFATEALAAGVDVGTASKMMGHTSPVMLLTHYQHVLDKQKREAVERLPDVSCVSGLLCV